MPPKFPAEPSSARLPKSLTLSIAITDKDDADGHECLPSECSTALSINRALRQVLGEEAARLGACVYPGRGEAEIVEDLWDNCRRAYRAKLPPELIDRIRAFDERCAPLAGLRCTLTFEPVDDPSCRLPKTLKLNVAVTKEDDRQGDRGTSDCPMARAVARALRKALGEDATEPLEVHAWPAVATIQVSKRVGVGGIRPIWRARLRRDFLVRFRALTCLGKPLAGVRCALAFKPASQTGLLIMTQPQLEKQLTLQPFRPFWIKTSGGAKVRVAKPEWCWLPPELGQAIICDEWGGVHVVALAHLRYPVEVEPTEPPDSP